MPNKIRPVGYTGQVQYYNPGNDSIALTIYLWGGGGGGGGGGGSGSGGSYSQISLSLNPRDTLELAVGGGGGGGAVAVTNSPAVGGRAGASFVLGSTSFSGATGGYGINQGGGGGGGGASVALLNGVVVAVAAGGAGGGSSINAPGPASTAGVGVSAGQNGQNNPLSGGGGGAGSGGYQGGNGGAASPAGSSGAAGSNGTSYSLTGTTQSAINRLPGGADQPYWDGLSGRGGLGGTGGASGTIVLEFSDLPGLYVHKSGRWNLVETAYIKTQGQWQALSTVNMRINDAWQPVISGFAPNLLTIDGKFGVNARAFPDPVPSITSLSWIPSSSAAGGNSALTWTTVWAASVDYTVEFLPAPAPPPPPAPAPPPPPPATYSLIGSAASVTKGQTFTVTFITNQPGSFGYTIAGVTSADINGAALSGVVTNGQVLTYQTTAGEETFVITLANGAASTSVRINDPEPAQFVQGTFSGPTFVPQTGQDQVDLAVFGPSPGIYNYSVTGSPAVNFDSRSGNPPNGVFNWSATGLSNLRASLNLQTPHPATTLTATISRDGFQPFIAQLFVPARSGG